MVAVTILLVTTFSAVADQSVTGRQLGGAVVIMIGVWLIVGK
jgi:hypothetical protein